MRLSYTYPSTLEKWDRRDYHPWEKIEFEEGLDFRVVDLAQEFGLSSILPAAFFTICEVRDNPVEEILYGVGDDGQRITLSTKNQKICI